MIRTDEEIFFSKSFNEQMSWIGQKVEHIIRNNESHKIKKKLKEKGNAAYEENEYIHNIKRLFDIIKSDPKNKGVLREICKAEQELFAYLYDELDARTEEEILVYWNVYLQSYIAELGKHPLFALVEGFDKGRGEDKKVEIIGIYDSIAKLEDAYICALDKLERKQENMKQVLGNMEFQSIKHEKIMINVFDESLGKWEYDVKPGQLFWKEW